MSYTYQFWFASGVKREFYCFLVFLPLLKFLQLVLTRAVANDSGDWSDPSPRLGRPLYHLQITKLSRPSMREFSGTFIGLFQKREATGQVCRTLSFASMRSFLLLVQLGRSVNRRRPICVQPSRPSTSMDHSIGYVCALAYAQWLIILENRRHRVHG